MKRDLKREREIALLEQADSGLQKYRSPKQEPKPRRVSTREINESLDEATEDLE
jgi:hypothetical protein